MKMNINIVYIYLLSMGVYANITNDLITDYFYYKKVPNVIRYSCSDKDENILLMKSLSHHGIFAATTKLSLTTSVEALANTTHYKVGIFLDTRSCNTSHILLIFSEASANLMYGELHNWLILGYNLSHVIDIVDDRVFGFSTDFVIAISPNDEEYELFDTYNLGWEYGRSLNITFLGSWTKENGLEIALTQTRFLRRSNSRGLILRAAFFKTVYQPPEMSAEDYFQDHTHAEKENLLKFGFNLLRHLSDLLNFDLQCIITPEWQTGDSVGPVIRAIINNKADIIGSPMAKNIPRTYWVKYVHQDWPFRTCFIFRNPQPKYIKFQEILRPFEDSVWYFVIIFIGLSIALLAFIARLDWIESKYMRLSHAFLVTIGAFCQQGTNMEMDHISTRITFFFIMIFSLLTYNYYSAGVVSARFNEPIVKINDSLSELSKLPVTVASEYMTYFDYHVKKNDWEMKIFYVKRWSLVSEKNRFLPPEEGLPLVKLGGFAYHTHPDVAYPFIERHFENREVCELTEVNFIQPNWSGFAVRFNSSIIEMSRIGFTKILEVGLRHRQVKRWQYRKPVCNLEKLSVSSVDLYDFSAQLLLLLIGYMIYADEIQVYVHCFPHDIHEVIRKAQQDVQVIADWAVANGLTLNILKTMIAILDKE
ncbi:ionotropic receptor 75a-like [Phymastichus coffea]|uniref:ionotropic receptor 75a-like n=1 Tax=Phymastichus coffea TaxID=108790 RepID=UPI00273BFEA6|nr:ionotropic receptor 75a-like [Phymastichus coffea]